MPLVRNKKCTGGNIPNMSKTQEICKEKVQNYITVQTTKRDQLERPRAGREEEVSLVCRRTASKGFPNTLPQLLVVLATGSVSQQ